MKTTPEQEANYLYDLSNPHFANTQLITTDDKIMKGQFVQFKVVQGDVAYLYPAEKYCFVPEDKLTLFRHEYQKCHGAFDKIPDYVVEVSMRHIRQIILSPVLVP